jgi:hypothetical protein
MTSESCAGSAPQLISERPARLKNEVDHLLSRTKKDGTDRRRVVGIHAVGAR